MSTDLALPQLNIGAMIAYLERGGWEVVGDKQFVDGYRCTRGGRGYECLREAMKHQVARDIEMAFQSFGSRIRA